MESSFFSFSNIKSLFFENKNVKQIILKNTFWLTLAEVISKGVSFFLLIWIARYFGPTNYGKIARTFNLDEEINFQAQWKNKPMFLGYYNWGHYKDSVWHSYSCGGSAFVGSRPF